MQGPDGGYAAQQRSQIGVRQHSTGVHDMLDGVVGTSCTTLRGYELQGGWGS